MRKERTALSFISYQRGAAETKLCRCAWEVPLCAMHLPPVYQKFGPTSETCLHSTRRDLERRLSNPKEANSSYLKSVSEFSIEKHSSFTSIDRRRRNCRRNKQAQLLFSEASFVVASPLSHTLEYMQESPQHELTAQALVRQASTKIRFAMYEEVYPRNVHLSTARCLFSPRE